MRFSKLIFLICLILLIFIEKIDLIKCLKRLENSVQGECEGEACFLVNKSIDTSNQIIQDCVVGVDFYQLSSERDYYNNSIFYCNSDYCNKKTLINSTNISILPIIKCYDYDSTQIRPFFCNKCFRTKFYHRTENEKAIIDGFGCNSLEGFNSFQISYKPTASMIVSRFFSNFFPNSCYNFTIHPIKMYFISCRCDYSFCNDPNEDFPYSISPSTIKCHADGYQNLLGNGTNIGNQEECMGHYCFLALNAIPIVLKGCISANENGPIKLKMGHTYFAGIDYYICDRDYCNSDVVTSQQESAKKSTETEYYARKNSQKTIVFHFLTFIYLIFFQNLIEGY